MAGGGARVLGRFRSRRTERPEEGFRLAPVIGVVPGRKALASVAEQPQIGLVPGRWWTREREGRANRQSPGTVLLGSGDRPEQEPGQGVVFSPG